MSKNLTRKGLAFGALVALASSVIAGSPALAAGEVTLTPSAGTSYSLISGETYTLTAATGSLVPSSSYVRLKTKVTNNSAIAYTTSATQTGAVFSGTASNASSVASVVIKDADGSGTTGSSAAVGIAVAASAAGNFSVQSWLDDNGNDAIDAGEFASETRTVTFVKPADVTATTVITAPTEGDTTVSATVKFEGINNEQLPAANVGAYFTKGDGTALDANTTSSVVRFGTTWSATDFFKFTTATVAAQVKDKAVKVQPLYKLTGLAATDAASTIGTAVTATVVTRKAATIVASTVVSTTASATESLLNSSFAVKALVKDGASTPVAVANLAVTAVVSTSATLTSTAPAKTLTVNGTSYSSNAALPGTGSVAKLALTTNAAGEAIVSLTTVGFAAGETVTVSFTTENLAASAITNTQRAATYTASVNSAAVVASAVDGASVPVAVSVYDQFGGAPADKYDVTATLSSSGQATTAATAAGSNSNVALVGGKATIGLVENGTGVGTNVYNLEVKERLAGAQYGSTVVTAVPFSVKIVAAAQVAGVVTSSTGTQNSTTKIYEVAGPIALSLNDVKNADTRKVVETAPTVTNNQALAGTVTTAASATAAAAAIAGASVTLSGTGLQFYAGSVYAGSSLTVATDTSGAWAANVTSNKAGKQTITVTSGSATATITVVFAAAAEATGSVLAIVAPTRVAPGSTLTVQATLVDKYGNPVAVPNTSASSATSAITYAGPGFTVPSSITQTLDSSGQSTFRVIIGSNDSGSATITFTYDSDGSGATAVKTATAVVIIGAPVAVVPTAAVAGSTKRFFVTVDSNESAKNVVVKVAGKTFKTLKGSSAKKTYVVAAPKGSHKVTVFVGGKLVATKTISVK
jgi:hypothetical protein